MIHTIDSNNFCCHPRSFYIPWLCQHCLPQTILPAIFTIKKIVDIFFMIRCMYKPYKIYNDPFYLTFSGISFFQLYADDDQMNL